MFPIMPNKIHELLSVSLVKLLRPLVRILLRYGFSFGEFAEIARWIYVDVADKDFSIEGKKQSISRISVITGLNRKDVTSLKQINIHQDHESSSGFNRAGRVISGWVRDQAFHDEQGNPAELPLEGEDKSFTALVKQYSGDMPVRAVLDELLRIEAVNKREDDSLCLLTKAYIPKNVDTENIFILGDDGTDLIGTIDHNLAAGKNPPFFQRKVVYDNVPVERIENFRKISSSSGQHLLEKLNEILAANDRDCNPEVKGSGRMRVGMGIYYFEEDLNKNQAPDNKE
jgi:hypothetical protein